MTWDERVLCPNQACIGVLGSDGRCPQCGATDDVTRVAAQSPADDGDADDDDADDGDAGDGDADDVSSAGAAIPVIDAYRREPADWSVRELCADGACIGVVHGGVCNACGRRSDG